MRMIVHRLLYVVILLLATALIPGRAQDALRAEKGVTSATIAAKKPVFAGACKACPWGILA